MTEIELVWYQHRSLAFQNEISC